ncbi:MAG: hypothetical protein P1V81_15315 [Planctomycetota bacterium]|nr:hypothetical protein [Planctomycetota bacterium]
MAIKMQAEYGDALQVIFVESQGAKPEAAERFALERKWFGTQAMWTTERPFDSGGRGLPAATLLDANGAVLLSGSSSMLGGKIEDHIEDFMKSRKKFPKAMNKDLKKAWTFAQKGKVADALEELAELEAEGGETGADASELRASIEAKVESRLKAITWMLDNGYPIDASEELEALTDDVDEHEAFSARCSELVAKLEAEEMADELKAAAALAKLQEKLFADGPDEKLAKKLTKLAGDYPGSKVAARATHLASLAK